MSDQTPPPAPVAETPTLPAFEAAKPTPTAMPAMTLEYRMKLVEDQLRDLAANRPAVLAELRAEMASIRADLRTEYQAALAKGFAEEETKRKALEQKFYELSSQLQAEMGEQTTMLKGLVSDMAVIVKSVSGVFANPQVRKYGMSILVSLSVILGVISTWLVARSSAPAPPPAPTPTVTVIVPKDVPVPSPQKEISQ